MQLYNYRKKRKRKLPRGIYASDHQRHHRHRKHRASRDRRLRKTLTVTAFVFAVILAVGCGSFMFLRSTGKSALMKYAGTEHPNIQGLQEEGGLVSRNGKKYRYNEDIITLLCMGVDQGSESWGTQSDHGENGQADAIFLAVLNPHAHTLKLIGISRDTMTEIATYDRQGNYVGTSQNHLALAFSYGTSKQEGAELVKNAVSNLFYHLPIHGYAAIDWDALGKINDSVGGVTVTLTEDMVLAGELHYSGESIRLTGEQTKSFVRQRGDELGSNNARMQRQKMYASAFVREAAEAIRKDPLLAADLYQELTADMTTSIGINEAVYLASLIPSLRFNTEDIQMVEGEIRQGARYEEFYVEEDKLTDLILANFYDEAGGTDHSQQESEDTEKAVDFEELKEINPDVYAWITVPGTSIDTPVLQKEGDVAYYLNHDWLGEENADGAICSESQFNGTDFEDPHTVLYGNHCSDGKMFGSLRLFEDEDFFETHRTIEVYTPDATLYYRIFAAYEYDSRHLLQSFDCSTPKGMDKYIQEVLSQRNLYAHIDETALDLKDEDMRVLTLSTVSSRGEGRTYLVQGILEEKILR